MMRPLGCLCPVAEPALPPYAPVLPKCAGGQPGSRPAGLQVSGGALPSLEFCTATLAARVALCSTRTILGLASDLYFTM